MMVPRYVPPQLMQGGCWAVGGVKEDAGAICKKEERKRAATKNRNREKKRTLSSSRFVGVLDGTVVEEQCGKNGNTVYKVDRSAASQRKDAILSLPVYQPDITHLFVEDQDTSEVTGFRVISALPINESSNFLL